MKHYVKRLILLLAAASAAFAFQAATPRWLISANPVDRGQSGPTGIRPTH